MTHSNSQENIIIIGAGPAGLGAAYELSRQDTRCQVYDKNDSVGGLARTFYFHGYPFDVGPHRFYTKNNQINQLWQELLGADLLPVKRLTRIYYRNKLFYYPIRPMNALWNLGFLTSAAVFFSYLGGKFRFWHRPPKNFEEWMVKHFGRRLYAIFFKTYTEKVWGISCQKLGPEWAGQRIKNLNLGQAISRAFFKSKDNAVKSLVEEFYYPRGGAGVLYQRLRQRITAAGSAVVSQASVETVRHQGKRITAVEVTVDKERRIIPTQFLFSSMPITALVRRLRPTADPAVLAAADRLRYRDHLTVNLLMEQPELFPDQWIYIHDHQVQMARVTNYRNFFPPSEYPPGATPLSVEYFVFADSSRLWQSPDSELIQLACRELVQVGLIQSGPAPQGFVVREKDSYPAYYIGYQREFAVLKNYLARFVNLQLIGRAGMYKYNNQDHALLTGILAARNFLGESHDLWSINADDEYLEVKKT